MSPSPRDMNRADAIVEWAVETGRNPSDTAGMDTDDENWLNEHEEYEEPKSRESETGKTEEITCQRQKEEEEEAK